MRKPSWAVTTAVLSLTAAAVCSPAAANAKFTAKATMAVTASTATLAVPDADNGDIWVDCDSSGGVKKMRVMVDRFPTAGRATNYQLVITDPKGNISTISEAAALANGFAVPGSGTWTYAVRGSYQVPGTANIWTGPSSAPKDITC